MKQNQEKNFTHQNLRAKHLFTGDKIFFESHHQAQQWITKNHGWTLQRCQEIIWSFPLDQTIKQRCWINL